MVLLGLEVRFLRVLREVEWAPGEGLNLIVGGNGAGKTSLLEAVFLTARGRSFRSGRWVDLITEGMDAGRVEGRYRSDGGAFTRVEVRQLGAVRRMEMDGKAVQTREAVVRKIPLRLLHSHSGELILGGPALRRSFVDWNLFHVEPSYPDLWRRYRRCHAQKSAILKEGRGDLGIWNRELALHGDAMVEARAAYVQAMNEELTHVVEGFGPLSSLRVGYETKGYSGDLGSALDAIKEQEWRSGQCLVGPHRDDLTIEMDGHLCKGVASAGQARLAVAALQIAAERIFRARMARSSIWLLDDLGAEWDEQAQADCLRGILKVAKQCLVTSIGRPKDSLLRPYPHTLFHVEHGVLSRI